MSTQTAGRATGQSTRPWYPYRIRTARGTLLYIGITQQRASIARLEQHVGVFEGGLGGGKDERPKWWAPLAADWRRDPQGYATREIAEHFEAELIRRERPRCNIQHNDRNRDRWRSWADVPAEERPQDQPVIATAPRPAMWTPRHTRLAWRYGRWPAAWLVAVLGLWWAIGSKVPAVAGIEVSAIAVTILAVVAWERSRPKRRRRKR